MCQLPDAVHLWCQLLLKRPATCFGELPQSARNTAWVGYVQHSLLAPCLPQLISPCHLQEINYRIQDYDPPPPLAEALDQPGGPEGNASRHNASGRAQVSPPGPGHDACVTLCDPFDDTSV